MEQSSRCQHLIAVAHELIQYLADDDLWAAFLFSSAAWGDADEASDLDIMLLVDRPPPYRKVTRVRVPELLVRTLPDGPLFADLDRCAVVTFTEAIQRGAWAQRALHSVVLKDTDGFYTQIRARARTEYVQPAARMARFRKHQERSNADRGVIRDGGTAAMLATRLALESAAFALIEINHGRFSATHFVENIHGALAAMHHEHLYAPLIEALALHATEASIQRNLLAYETFANMLKEWMSDAAIRAHLSIEEAAWSEFTYGAQTYEEIFHKVATFRKLGKLATLQYYLDGLLLVPIRINVGRVLLLRSTGSTGRLRIPEFHTALEQHEPLLFTTRVEALRLHSSTTPARTDDLADQLWRMGTTTLSA